MRILDCVGSKAVIRMTKNANDDVAAVATASSSPSTTAVRVDPIEPLPMGERAREWAVLHVAIGESTYNFSVAQALRNCFENPARDAAAAVQLASARTRTTKEPLLHALVCAANAEDALVETLVRRLLALGADSLARNAALQSIMEVAVSSRPDCSSKAGQKLYETLLSASYAKYSTGSFLSATNQKGPAAINVANALITVKAVARDVFEALRQS